MSVPIGHLLVEQGVITREQCEAVLDRQRSSGRPFGDLAEELFGVSARAVEKAWSDQFAQLAEWVDPTIEPPDPAVLGTINRRQAWQFRVLPLSQEGDTLTVCTTQDSLVRAVNFASRHYACTCYFVLAKPLNLGEALMRHYPMDGMTREMIAGPLPPAGRK
jgi:hypothetical protein